MAKRREDIELNMCEEAPVDLVVNGKKLVTFMCTPQNLKELALGHLVSRGLIGRIDEVYALAACEEMRQIFVKTAQELDEVEYGLANVLASGCGSGSILRDDFLSREKISSRLRLPIAKLREIARQMFRGAVLYKKTGGVHCAFLAGSQGIHALMEDVGRHNAVDKAIGKGMLLDVDFSNCVLLTTGRISSDMVLKAVAIGTPIVVSRSIPTTLAVEIAGSLGITLVGRIAASRPLVYCHQQRIISSNEEMSSQLT